MYNTDSLTYVPYGRWWPKFNLNTFSLCYLLMDYHHFFYVLLNTKRKVTQMKILMAYLKSC